MAEDHEDGRRNSVALWVCIILVLCSIVGGITLYTYLFATSGLPLQNLVIDHFIAVFGLPGAAAAAFILVTLFRQGEAPIRIQALGLNVEGAAGPIVLWVLCFLAICAGMKLLW